MGYAAHFSAALGAEPGRLHVAAHSHHPWPDVTRAAHLAAWDLAGARLDEKWDEVFGVILPEAAGHIAGRLRLPDPSTIAFGATTHEFVARILSSLPSPVRVLTTDAEFYSAARQLRRLTEDGLAVVEAVPAEPFPTFGERFVAAAGRGGADLVVLSQAFFNSGFVVEDLAGLIAAVPSETAVLIDGYHGFMALDTDLADLADRVFYTSAGYKYAMAGEGAAFLHAPPGWLPRPRNTGWFAAFGGLGAGTAGGVDYPADGRRFLGGTLDSAPWLRFNAVQRWVDEVGLDVAAIHRHVRRLQECLLDALADRPAGPLGPATLLPGREVADRGNFLTFHTPAAGRLHDALRDARVITDRRGDRLRIGFGIYHDDAAVVELLERLRRVVADGP